MDPSSVAPSGAQRAAAIASLVLVTGVLVATVFVVADDLWKVLAGVALLAVAALAAWHALTRVGTQRALAGTIAVLALVAIVALEISRDRATPARWCSASSCWGSGSRWVGTLWAGRPARFGEARRRGPRSCPPARAP